MFGQTYDMGTVISAIATFSVIVLGIRVYLSIVARNKTTIQKPDWLDDERFEDRND